MTIVLWPKYCKLADYECIARSKQKQCNQLIKQDTLLKLKQRLMKVLPVVRGTPNTTVRTDHNHENSHFIDKLIKTKWPWWWNQNVNKQ